MADTIETQLRTQLVAQKQSNLDGIAKLQSNVEAIDSKIAKFDEVFGTSTQAAPTRKKPGPKPKAQKTAKVAGIKTGKKVAAKAAGGKTPKKTAGKKSVNRATQGRRDVAAGHRPSLKDAMTQVAGNKDVNASDIYEALKAKNWLPNSNDPRQYISYSLSSFKDRFERVESKGRGFYKVRAGAATNGTTGAAKAAKVETKEVEAEKTEPAVASSTQEDVDAVLQSAGVLPATPAN
jgi:hypothetical protein